MMCAPFWMGLGIAVFFLLFSFGICIVYYVWERVGDLVCAGQQGTLSFQKNGIYQKNIKNESLKKEANLSDYLFSPHFFFRVQNFVAVFKRKPNYSERVFFFVLPVSFRLEYVRPCWPGFFTIRFTDTNHHNPPKKELIFFLLLLLSQEAGR